MAEFVTKWIRQRPVFNTVLDDIEPSIGIDPSGNAYVAYITDGTIDGQTSSGGSDIVVFKVNSTGTTEWVSQHPSFNTSGNDLHPSIGVDKQGNSYVVYHTNGTASGQSNSGEKDIVVFKLDTYGQTVWVKQTSSFNTFTDEQSPSIAVDSLGNSYIAHYILNWTSITDLITDTIDPTEIGFSPSTIRWQSFTPLTDCVLTQYGIYGKFPNPYGHTLRARLRLGDQYGTVLNTTIWDIYDPNPWWMLSDLASAIPLTGAQLYTITFENLSIVTEYKLYYYTNNYSGGNTELNNGRDYVFQVKLKSTQGYNIVVFKLNPDGVLQWIKEDASFNTPTNEDIDPSIAIDSSGNSYISYVTDGTASGQTPTGNLDIVVFKLDNNGNTQWVIQQPLFNTTSDDQNPKVTVDNLSNIYVVYYTSGVSSGQSLTGVSDIIVFKLDKNGTVVWVKQEPVFNTSGTNVNPSIANSNGYLYVTYCTDGIMSGQTNTGNYDIAVFKMDLNGTTMMVYQDPAINTTDIDVYPVIAVNTQGKTYISYQTTGNTPGHSNRGDYDIVLFQLSETININLEYSGVIPVDDYEGIMYTYTVYNIGESTLDLIHIDDRTFDYDFTSVASGDSVITNYYYLISAPEFTAGVVNSQAVATGTYLTNSVTSTQDLSVLIPDRGSYSIYWVIQHASFNTTGQDYDPVITVDSNGNVYVAYYSSGTASSQSGTGGLDIIVFKLNNNGGTLWIKQNSSFNTSLDDLYPTIAGGTDGSVYIAYQTKGNASAQTNVGNDDIVLFKLDTNGNTLWTIQNTLPNTTGRDYAPAIAVDSSNNIYLTYSIDGNPGVITWDPNVSEIHNSLSMTEQGFDVNVTHWQSFTAQSNRYISSYGGWIASRTATAYGSFTISLLKDEGLDGILLHTQTLGPDPSTGYLWHMATPSPPIQVVAGYRYTIVVKCISGSGVLPYIKWAYSNDVNYVCGISDIDGNNDYWFQVQTTQPNNCHSQIEVVKLDTNGNVIWSYAQPNFNTLAFDDYPSIAADTTGPYITYVTSGTASAQTLTGQDDIVVFKLDVSGNLQWIIQQPIFNTLQINTQPSITIDSTGNSYVAFATNDVSSGQTNSGRWDIVVMKLNNSGVIQWVTQQPTFNTVVCDTNPSIAVNTNGEVCVAYETLGTASGQTSVGSYDVVFFVLDTNGVVEIVRQEHYFNTSGAETYPAIALDSDNRMYMAYQTTGAISGENFGGNDILVAKVNPNPNLIVVFNTFSGAITGSGMTMAGTPIIYTYNISNVGNVTLGNVVYTDDLGENNVIGAFPVGTYEDSYIYTITQSDIDAGSVSNKGKVYGRFGIDDITVYSSVFTNPIVQNPELTLEEYTGVVVNTDPLITRPGDKIRYSFKIRNTGNVTLHNVRVDDDGHGLHYFYGDLAPGLLVLTSVLEYEITQIDINNKGVESQATVRADLVTDQPSPYITVPIIQTPLVDLTPSTEFIPDTGVVKPGDLIRYTYKVTNTGNITLSSIIVTDQEGEDIVRGALAPGAYWEVVSSNEYIVTQTDVYTGSVSKSATATGQFLDTPVTSTKPIVTLITLIYSILIDLYYGTLSSSTIEAGSPVTYVFKIVNSGNVPLTNVNISDTHGASFHVDDLPTLGYYDNTNMYYVTTTDIDFGSINSQATVTAQYEVNPVTNTKVTTVALKETPALTQWITQQYTFNTTGNEINPSIAMDPNGNVYVAYTTDDQVSGQNTSGGTDIAVFKANNAGQIQWVAQHSSFNTNQNDNYPHIVVDTTGNTYITYYTTGLSSGQTKTGGNDIVVYKLNTNGQTLWVTQQPSFNTAGSDVRPKIAIDNSNNVYVTYYTDNVTSGQVLTGGVDVVVFKLNSNGVTQWVVQQNAFNTVGTDDSPAIAVDSSGNVFVVYVTNDQASGQTVTGNDDIVVFKLNNLGQTQWVVQQPSFNTTSNDSQPSIAVDQLGNVIIVYTTTGRASEQTTTGNNDLVVFKLDTNGQTLWAVQQPSFNTGGDDQLPAIWVDSSNNSYIVYYTDGSASGQTRYGLMDIVVFKLDEDGETKWITQQSSFNTSQNDINPSVIGDNNGVLYIAFQTDGTTFGGTNMGGYDIVIFKLNEKYLNCAIEVYSGYLPSYESPTITYTYGVRNTGVVPLYNVIISDTNGINITIGILGPDELKTVSGEYTVTHLDILAGQVDSTATMVGQYLTQTVTAQKDATVTLRRKSFFVEWITQTPDFNTTSHDLHPSITLDSDGNAYIAYFTNKNPPGGSHVGGLDIVVFKLNRNGAIQWVRQNSIIDTVVDDVYPNISIDSNKNIYIAYYTQGTASGQTNTGTNDIVVFKLNNNGETQWVKQQPSFNTSASDTYPAIAVDPNGNSYVSYTTKGVVSGAVVTWGPYVTEVNIFNSSPTANIFAAPNACWQSFTAPSNHFIGRYAVYISNLDTISGVYGFFTMSLLEGEGPSGTVISVLGQGIDFSGAHWRYAVLSTPYKMIYGHKYTVKVTCTSGNVAWYYNGNIYSGGKSSIDDNNDFYIRIDTQEPSIYGDEIAVFKLDTDGNTQWIKENDTFLTYSADTDPAIAVDPNGNSYVVYFSDGSEGPASGQTMSGGTDIVIFKLNSNGQTQWVKQNQIFNTSSNEANPSIVVDSAGNIYIAYNTTGKTSGQTKMGGTDIVVLKLDNDGQVIWIRQQPSFNTSDDDINARLGVDGSNNVYVCYQTIGSASMQTNSGESDIVVFMLSSSGDTKWVSQLPLFNTTGNDIYPSIVVSNEAKIYGAYQTSGVAGGQINSGGYDIVVFKLNASHAQILLEVYEGVITNQDLILAGDEVKYTFGIRNVGIVTLTGVFIDDNRGNSILLDPSDMAPGEFRQVTGTYALTQTDINAGFINSRAVVVGLYESENVISQKDTTVTIRQEPSIEWDSYSGLISTSIMVMDSTVVSVALTYEVFCSGNVPLTDVTITDSLGVTVNVGEMNAQEHRIITKTTTYTVKQDDIDRGYFTSSATVTGYYSTQKLTSTSDITNILILQVLLAQLTMTYDPLPTEVHVGDRFTYYLTIAHDGNVTLKSIIINDQLANQDRSYTDIAPGRLILTNVYLITQADLDQGFVYNTANITGVGGTIGDGVNSQVFRLLSNDVRVRLEQFASLDIDRTFNTVPITAQPGDTVTCFLIPQNIGNVSLHSLYLNSPLVGITNYPIPNLISVQTSIAAQTSSVSRQTKPRDSTEISEYVVGCTYTLKKDDFIIGYVILPTTLIGKGIYNRSYTIEKNFLLIIQGGSSIVLYKTTDPITQQLNVGDPITYHLTVKNNGKTLLHDIKLNDELLGLIDLSIPDLSPYDQYEINAQYVLQQADFQRGYVSNIASVSGVDPGDQTVSSEVTIKTVPCVVHGTMILLANGQYKPVQDIQRGDIVSPNHKVARLCITYQNRLSNIELVIFPPNSLGWFKPNRELIITENHPIFYHGARRPAKCFKGFNNIRVERVSLCTPLYDIQFDHEGSYIANGIEIQSCSPRSEGNPLPREEYFDQSSYSEETVWDTYDHTLALDTTPVINIIGKR